MIYVYRTLYSLGAIPVYFFTCICFLVGLVTFPFVSSIYYVIHGSTSTMKWEVDTMANCVSKKYSKLKDLIEKQK